MAEELSVILKELTEIKTCLVNVDSSRRLESVLLEKYEQAKETYSRYTQLNDAIQQQVKIGKIPKEEFSLILKLCENFTKLYKEVSDLCRIKKVSKMAEDTFNLKTALSLLPMMTDDVLVTKQLIESIEYYESVLAKPECKKKLILFVMKNRLSQTAKLKLKCKYDTVSALLKDMRKLLLPQKSAAALLTKLQNAKQQNRSISDYGKEISELFVDLTISQADGDSEKHAILKPLNEKLAIKRFADGLRDRRLSTIVAARDLKSLSDAIQAAQDEEVSSSSGAERFMGTYHTYNSRRNFSSGRPSRGHKSRYRGQRGFYHSTARFRQGYRNGNLNRQSSHTYRAGQGAGRGNFRGRYNGNRSQEFSNHKNINMISSENDTTESPNTELLNHFFRD